MKLDRICGVSTCEERTVHADPSRYISTEFLAENPLAYKLCAEHFGLACPNTALPAPRKRQNHPAYAMFGHTPPTCYGLAGTCPEIGTLFPSGVWCFDHVPR